MAPARSAALREAVHSLAPHYFALVMASGIISVGLQLKGFRALSDVLMWVCAVSFVVLCILFVWRLVAYREAFLDDFTDASRGFGFFTFVAGTNVLGVRLASAGFPGWTAALLVLSGLSWLVLGYVVPWTAVLGRTARPVIATANGTWFVWVVASQSVAVAAATLEPVASGPWRRELALLAVCSWSVGIFLYAAAGIFVANRMMSYELTPKDLTPAYWVSMGACAITVLAGARVVEMADAPMVASSRGLVGGMSIVFWAFATWLIPALVAAGWWRHVSHHVPLVYDPTLWSVIFPLGMYSVGGIYLARAQHLPLVGAVGSVGIWIAFAAWLLTFVAMVRHVVLTTLLAR